MKQAKFYIILTIVSIILLSVARVVVTNTISTNGSDLSKIESKISEYKKQNSLLQEEILDRSSLNNIASKSAELGFVASKKEMVLTSPLPLALNQ